MNWKKLRPQHFFDDPVEHIYAMALIDSLEYDKLYENQNNLNHAVWQDFDTKYSTGYEFKEDFSDINFNKEIMCLWFFKERSDRTIAHVVVNGKKLPYTPNTFLITTSKDIKLEKTKRKYIRHPLVQLDLTTKKYKEICQLTKNTKKN